MFFSLIRASNQLAPKTKVVDLLSLYNFYFGQIAGFNMKFGVLGSQTLIKIISNEFNSVLCRPCFQCPADLDGGAATRRGPGDPPPPLKPPAELAMAKTVLALPFHFLAPRAEPSEP